VSSARLRSADSRGRSSAAHRPHAYWPACRTARIPPKAPTPALCDRCQLRRQGGHQRRPAHAGPLQDRARGHHSGACRARLLAAAPCNPAHPWPSAPQHTKADKLYTLVSVQRGPCPLHTSPRARAPSHAWHITRHGSPPFPPLSHTRACEQRSWSTLTHRRQTTRSSASGCTGASGADPLNRPRRWADADGARTHERTGLSSTSPATDAWPRARPVG
jgi:hypothetical protein